MSGRWPRPIFIDRRHGDGLGEGVVVESDPLAGRAVMAAVAAVAAVPTVIEHHCDCVERTVDPRGRVAARAGVEGGGEASVTQFTSCVAWDTIASWIGARWDRAC